MRASQETPTPTTSLPQSYSYVAVAPAALRAGQTENIALTLLRGNQPAQGQVRLALFQDGDQVTQASAIIQGNGTVSLPVPTSPGQYQLQVSGPGFDDRAEVRVQDGTLVLLETDKPIYKPGRTIHIRTLTLDAALKSVAGTVMVDAQDAKGTRVFKKEVNTDEYGMATLGLPLSTEPNLGVWKITAQMGERTAQRDVRVEEYVLPKYEVLVNPSRNWSLASEPITGTVSAEYTFDKPVVGQLEIVASRYVGQWEEYATLTLEIDGQAEFELPPVGYVAGVPAAQAMGNITLSVTVWEKDTGYSEEVTHLLT